MQRILDDDKCSIQTSDERAENRLLYLYIVGEVELCPMQ